MVNLSDILGQGGGMTSFRPGMQGWPQTARSTRPTRHAGRPSAYVSASGGGTEPKQVSPSSFLEAHPEMRRHLIGKGLAPTGWEERYHPDGTEK